MLCPDAPNSCDANVEDLMIQLDLGLLDLASSDDYPWPV